MNSFLLNDQQFLLQQQLVLQQLIYLNSLIALKTAYSQQMQQSLQIQPESPQEIHTIEHHTLKNNEINDEYSSLELSNSQKLSKAIKKSKVTKSNNVIPSQTNTKKKIFLSMKDIKDVRYKKQNIQKCDRNKEIVTKQEEKN